MGMHSVTVMKFQLNKFFPSVEKKINKLSSINNISNIFLMIQRYGTNLDELFQI